MLKVFHWTAALIIASFSLACTKHSGSATSFRSYRMGFMPGAPRPDATLYVEGLTLMTAHADAMMISTEVPWDSLLNGESAVTYVHDSYVELVTYARSKNMKLWVFIDPENGLDRSSDSRPLVERGKSISQLEIQQMYRRFAVVMDSVLQPDHLGLALETNLIRAAAPSAIYNAVKLASNAAAADVRAIDPKVPLSVSIQAELAWGKAGGSTYAGIDQDFTDFPFLQELGISSYPYGGFSSVDEIPLDYYSRLLAGRSLPVFVSEGGWTSMNLTANGFSVTSSPAEQADYIRRQGAMLSAAKAVGVFQLTFTDLDLAGWGSDSSSLYPFAFLGVLDANFSPKPVLAVWDSLRTRTLKPGQ